ncbi:MAG TPA: hypothetical protein VIC57_06010 [Candidatus Dormibacteraeota bacterium]|jgi:hypothetical protein
MSMVAAAPPVAPRSGAREAIGSAGVATGIALVLMAAVVPWVTLLHGQQTVNGVGGDGAYLAAAAIGAGGLWAAYLLRGRPRQLRALVATAALVIVYWALYDFEHIVHMVIDDPMASVMGWPLMGPGPLLAAGGGALLLASTLTVPAGARGVRWGQWLRVLLGAALLTTGAVHLQQTPEHLGISTLLGLGFAAAAASQLALGAVVIVRGHRLLYAAIVASSAFFFAVYVYAVLHGLPFPSHVDPGLRVGAGETVTLSGAISKLGEAAAIMLALPLALTRRR